MKLHKTPYLPSPASILNFREQREVRPEYDPTDPSKIINLQAGTITYTLTFELPDGDQEDVCVPEMVFRTYLETLA